MKIVILKSKENLVWVSMNEIIPWIVTIWKKWARNRGHELVEIDIDGKEPANLFSEMFNSDLVIVTSFTTSMARLVYLAKGRLRIPFRCVIYLHNQATIACWPFFEWKMGDILDTRDVFVGSCSRDKLTMEACFQNANVVVHPFSLEEYRLEINPPSEAPLPHFVFIGRISPQKNLHTAIWAFYLLRIDHPELKWKFELFGSEDHYGSPLMGIGYNTYQRFLENLIEKLQLSDFITFRGFQKREDIQAEMESYQRIFLAPSLHSDENFGMAAFRTLSQGHKVILSEWGGHGDYREHFKDNLFLLIVREGSRGPFIDVQDLQRAIEESIQAKTHHSRNSAYYTEQSIFHTLDQISLMDVAQESLKRSRLGKSIHEKRNRFYEEEKKESERSGIPVGGCRIYEDFSDPDALEMFRAYGMNGRLKHKSGPLIKAPWVFSDPEGLIVDDPMKGKIRVPSGTRLETDNWLLNNGYASPIEEK